MGILYNSFGKYIWLSVLGLKLEAGRWGKIEKLVVIEQVSILLEWLLWKLWEFYCYICYSHCLFVLGCFKMFMKELALWCRCAKLLPRMLASHIMVLVCILATLLQKQSHTNAPRKAAAIDPRPWVLAICVRDLDEVRLLALAGPAPGIVSTWVSTNKWKSSLSPL